MLVFQDKFLDHKDFLFAVGVDENGYLPTHNTRFQKPLTGDPEQDLAGNRTKRKFDDPVGIAAAKNTEPTPGAGLPRATPARRCGTSPAPIFVKGKHWGGFRVGVSMQRIAARQRTLLLTLLGIFAVFAVVTIVTMYVVVQRAMRPVGA